jgi:O-antigen ligase
MHIETHSRDWFSKSTLPLALWVTGSLVLFALAYGAGAKGVEPSWVFVAVTAAMLVPVLIWKFPVFLIVGLTFVGQFKSRPATGFSVTDPTFVIWALLYAAVAVQLLRVTTSTEGPSLGDLFRGQAVGVSAFFLLILVIAISYAYTPAPGIGGDKVIRLIVFDCLAFVAPLILLRNDRDVRQLVRVTSLAGFLLAVVTIFRVLDPTAALLRGDQDITKIGAGLSMDAAFLMLLYYPLKAKPGLRLGVMLWLVVLTLGIAASVSRGAILCLLVVALVSSLLLRLDSRVTSRKGILLAVAACILVFSVAFVWLRHLPAASSKFSVKVQQLTMTLEGAAPSGTIEKRVDYSGSAWRAFLSKPILGWGAGGWSTLWHNSDPHIVLTYPHNFVLEIAAEQGLVGLLPLALLLAAIVRASAKVLQAHASLLVFIVPVVALSLIGNAVTGSVESREMWSWCGILFAFARMAQQDELHPAGSQWR